MKKITKCLMLTIIFALLLTNVSALEIFVGTTKVQAGGIINLSFTVPQNIEVTKIVVSWPQKKGEKGRRVDLHKNGNNEAGHGTAFDSNDHLQLFNNGENAVVSLTPKDRGFIDGILVGVPVGTSVSIWIKDN